MTEPLMSIEADMAIVYGGNRVTRVSPDLAEAFAPGDRVYVSQDTGDLLHVPAIDFEAARTAIDAAYEAFMSMRTVTDDQISSFYRAFADRLEEEEIIAAVLAANDSDVKSALARGRSTTRLTLTDEMRKDMVEGLRMWAETPTTRGSIVETIEHQGWSLDQVVSGLGVVGFVFEGRPNVLADACGVLRMGNTVVFRIGSDALETAKAIMRHAITRALEDSNLPSGAVSLVQARSHAAGWALFSDTRLGLAVARGSGAAVTQLGSVARQSGIPMSMHGAGGAWIVAAESADGDAFHSALVRSLDRKVCNTVNTVCIVESRAHDLIPRFLDGLDRAGEQRGAVSKLHVTKEASSAIPQGWFEDVVITRADGEAVEPRTELIDDESLGLEWEWESSPEVTLTVVPDVDTAVTLFNLQSPRFIASLISADPGEHARFFEMTDAPFVGNGFTRWVDGQYALDQPELGLSNWQFGRLFGRAGILSGESAYTIRSRAHQADPDLGR